MELPEGSPEIDRYLVTLVQRGGSDLHLSAGEAPMIRLDGDMMRLPDEARPERGSRPGGWSKRSCPSTT